MYRLPLFRFSQVMYSCASHQLTLITGRLPLPHPLSSGECLHPPSATQASHSSNVTSYLESLKEGIATKCCGPSSSHRPISDSQLPIRNLPAGMITISGSRYSLAPDIALQKIRLATIDSEIDACFNRVILCGFRLCVFNNH